MIRLLYGKTIGGVRFGAGSILSLDPAVEVALISDGDADRNALPQLIGQSFSRWTRSSVNAAGDASYTTLASVTVSGGTMGLNSKILITADWSFSQSTSTKYMSADFGSTSVSIITVNSASYPATKIMTDIMNMNSLSIQKTHNTHTYGVAAGPHLASAVPTADDAVIDFKCKWGAAIASETITLLGYSIWHYPGS